MKNMIYIPLSRSEPLMFYWLVRWLCLALFANRAVNWTDNIAPIYQTYNEVNIFLKLVDFNKICRDWQHLTHNKSIIAEWIYVMKRYVM